MASNYKSIDWIKTCIYQKTPVYIVKTRRFLKQQQDAKNAGALPYAIIAEISNDSMEEPWCVIDWRNSRGQIVYSNDYPRSCLDFYHQTNGEAQASLKEIEHYF